MSLRDKLDDAYLRGLTAGRRGDTHPSLYVGHQGGPSKYEVWVETAGYHDGARERVRHLKVNLAGYRGDGYAAAREFQEKLKQWWSERNPRDDDTPDPDTEEPKA